jgi:hypothetical protein
MFSSLDCTNISLTAEQSKKKKDHVTVSSQSQGQEGLRHTQEDSKVPQHGRPGMLEMTMRRMRL